MTLSLITIPHSAAASSTWKNQGHDSFHFRLNNLEHGQTAPLVNQAGPHLQEPGGQPHVLVDFEMGFLAQTGQTASLYHEFMPWKPLHYQDSSWDTAFRWVGETGFQLDLPGGFFCHQRTVIDSDPQLDPTSRTKEYRQIDASVEVPLAVVGFHRDEFTAYIGRRWDQWGPGFTGSLVLDAQAPAGDGWGLQWLAERWSAHYKCTRLNDGYPNNNGVPRYLGAHRIDFVLTEGFRLGLSETVVVATEGSFPFWLANPLLPWVLAQQEDRNGDELSNIIWGLDLAWKISPAWSLHGQFILDDAMVDLEDRDTHPDQLGYLAGFLYRPQPQGPWLLGAEYSRLGSWTYVHRQPDVRYSAWSGTLGHPQGPDSEAVTGFLQFPFPVSNQGGLVWGRWHRSGRNFLDTLETPVGSAGQAFPLPPVHTWWQFGTSTSMTLTHSTQLNIQLGYTDAPDLTIGTFEEGITYAKGWWFTTRISVPFFALRGQI